MDVEKKLDVVGIGALLVDYIIEKDVARNIDPKALFGADFEPGQTSRTSDGNYISNVVSKHPVKRFYAGSAFNALHAIASAKVGLNLGFIGVTGCPSNDIDFMKYTSGLGIDNKFICVTEEEKTGQCLSYLQRERTLLVYGGANILLGKYLEENQDAVSRYLSSSKWVHFSSFFDERYDTPSILYKILLEARKLNPLLNISFDPGHIYSQRKTEGIKRLLSLADYLFLNEIEFKYLGDVAPYAKDESLGRERVIELTGNSINVVLTKKYNSIHALHKFQDKVWVREYRNQRVPGILVKDDTGAGDVFASGFIMTQLVPILGNDIGPAVRLANRLVREKLKNFGSTQYDNFANIVQEYIRERHEQKRTSLKDWFYENSPQFPKQFWSIVLAFLLGLFTDVIAQILFK